MEQEEKRAKHNEYQRVWRNSDSYREKHAAYMREWTKNNPKKVKEIRRRWEASNPALIKAARKLWQEKNREKHLAHRAIDVLVNQAGWIKPTTCQHCGIECLTQAHHEDYSRRLDVKWLCVWCHNKIHRGEIEL
jgi:hypothetical protein